MRQHGHAAFHAIAAAMLVGDRVQIREDRLAVEPARRRCKDIRHVEFRQIECGSLQKHVDDVTLVQCGLALVGLVRKQHFQFIEFFQRLARRQVVGYERLNRVLDRA